MSRYADMNRKSSQIFKSTYKSSQDMKLTKNIQHIPPKTVETTKFRKSDYFEKQKSPLYKQTLQSSITSPKSMRSPQSMFSPRRFSPSVLKTPFENQSKPERPKSAPFNRVNPRYHAPPPIVKTIDSKNSSMEQHEVEQRMKTIFSEIEKMSSSEMEELVDMICARCQNPKFFEDHSANMWNTFMQKRKSSR